jgi:predicted ester cyclase
MTTDHQQLAERYLAMLNRHDPDAVDGFVAAGYINHNPFVADGREANRAFWSGFFTAFPDLSATMDDLIGAGDRVAGRFTYRATHRGPFYGIAPAGRPIQMRSIDIWRVQGRRVRRTLGRTQPARGVPAARRHPRPRPGRPAVRILTGANG